MDILGILTFLFDVLRNILSLIGSLFAVYQGFIRIYPQKTHLLENKLFKPIKKFTNRNSIISFKFFKACSLKQNVTKESFCNDLEKFFANKKNIIIKPYDDKVEVHFNKSDISFDYIIHFDMNNDYGDFIDSILINQNSEVKLKNVKTFLENSFWILKDLLSIFSINHYSEKIEVVISSQKFTFFDNTFNILGDSILGNQWNISKEGDITQISSNVPSDLDIIDKIIDLILLNITTN